MTRSINTNPEALRAMVRELRNADAAVDACMKKVRSALNASHWNDNVRADFDRNLEAIRDLAKQMSTISTESQAMLVRKAQQLENYLGL
jgi:uncharacterized protein YukE